MSKNGKFAGWTLLSLLVHGLVVFAFDFSEPGPSAGQPAGLRVSLVRDSTAEPAVPSHSVEASSQPGETTAPAEPPGEVVVTAAAEAEPSALKTDSTSVHPKVAASPPSAEPTPSVQPDPPQRPAASDLAKRTLGPQSESVQAATPDPSSHSAATPAPARQELQQALTRALLDHFSYPLKARRRHWEGEVVLRVTILHDGQVGPARIDKSSGYRLLDRAALESLRRVPSLAGFILEQNVDLLLPVIYRLRS